MGSAYASPNIGSSLPNKSDIGQQLTNYCFIYIEYKPMFSLRAGSCEVKADGQSPSEVSEKAK